MLKLEFIHVVLTLVIIVSSIPGGCATTANLPVSTTETGNLDFRYHETPRPGTIFSPLDLPTPNTIRTGSGAPGIDYWQQQADYVIKAELNTSNNQVTATARITYTNNSPDTLDYIWLHMEQNIFRNDSIGAYVSSETAIGMKDSFGTGYDINYIKSDETDLNFEVYDTVARVDIDKPISAHGGTYVLDISWSFIIPDNTFRRFGIEKVEQGTIYEVAQWFPAVAVYDDMYGWNTLPYLGTGEFYTNLGNFDVSITVPPSYIVAATGVLQNPQDVFTPEQQQRLENARTSDETVVIRSEDEVGNPASRPDTDQPLTWHYIAENVRTFAWASSDAFIYDACNLDGILVQSVYPKEAMPMWGKSTQMLRAAINGYSKKWLQYPYPEATNVSGAEGGMEYPMIIFCGSRRSEEGLYGVTTHEIGHNWFPMTINSDERRHAWMDEGFDTFINYYSKGDWFEGEYGGRGNAEDYKESMRDKNRVPICTYPDQLPGNLLGNLEYAKTAVGLVLLREQILGPERFDFAFRTYLNRWKFKSPRPADFFRTMEDAAGYDLAWFWRGWFMENSTLDQAVTDVIQEEFSVDGVRNEDIDKHEATIVIVNYDELVMPVVLKIKYADETEVTIKIPVEVWYSTNHYEYKLSTDKQIVSVEVDPEKDFPDMDRTNNLWELYTEQVK